MAKLERLVTPSGVKTISENGEYEIASYESVDVDVEVKVEIPQVSNLAIDEDGILTFDLPDYSELEQYNPTISYIININDNVLETSGNSISVKEYATEGENNVVVTTKVAINGLGKDGVVEYVPSEEGKNTIFTLNLTDANYLQPTVRIQGCKGTITINWGDGTIDTFTSNVATYDYEYKKTTPYSTTGVYTIKVSLDGTFGTFNYITITPKYDSDNTYQASIIDWTYQEDIFHLIYKNSFLNSQITTLVIPASITTIGEGALNTNTLQRLDLYPTTPPTRQTGFIASGAVITVPKGCLEAYQTATNWVTYASQMVEREE